MIVIGPSTNVNMGNVNRSMGAGGSLVCVGAGGSLLPVAAGRCFILPFLYIGVPSLCNQLPTQFLIKDSSAPETLTLASTDVFLFVFVFRKQKIRVW